MILQHCWHLLQADVFSGCLTAHSPTLGMYHHICAHAGHHYHVASQCAFTLLRKLLGALGEVVHTAHREGKNGQEQTLNYLGRFPAAALFPGCSGCMQGEERYSTLCILFSICPLGSTKPVHICKSTALCMYFQPRKGMEFMLGWDGIYTGVKMAVIEEIRMIRPKQRSQMALLVA